MRFNSLRIRMLVLLISPLWLVTAQASSRWDLLNWCTTDTRIDSARCEGFLIAAVDLRTSDDFTRSKSCFPPGSHIGDVRPVVIRWLRANPVTPEQSGLALVARALKEQFPCPEE
jgi:hypothetical protein